MIHILRPIAIVVCLSTPAALLAQTPAPATPAPAEQPSVKLPSPPADYVYSPHGRRDPFISLIKRGADPSSPNARRADGVGGLQTAEIAVRGIVLSRGAWAAIVAAPDGKVYTMRTGDRLSDGVVRTVTAQYLAVVQEVKDPLSIEKQREVRKYLRGGEEVK